MTEGLALRRGGVSSVEWYTPPYIFKVLGLKFDLDPCQPPGGISWIPATRHLTVEDDGLYAKWDGRVWLNPPYGKKTTEWLERMSIHRNGVALVFSRTDCSWFHRYIATADAILFLRGRVKFVDGSGCDSKAGPGCGSVMAAWGDDNVQAIAGMKSLGTLMTSEYQR